jgi:hypothetical protein
MGAGPVILDSDWLILLSQQTLAFRLLFLCFCFLQILRIASYSTESIEQLNPNIFRPILAFKTWTKQ